MDRQLLHEALKAAGVPAGLYEIAGRPRPDVPRSETWLYLEEEAGQWVVGVQERGVRTVLERFPDEDHACRGLYARLTDKGPPQSPLTPEETTELLFDSETIQHRAREQLAQALNTTRRQPHDDPHDDPHHNH
ncbi:hypothetical protein GCM10027073_29270 [Streptomyces chlorus]|uniref:Uncharacterized protein n=1 Tax=Streptomyces chlorus TaxID=887452 RepID=A0ABW1E378_9ACTN